MIDRAERGVVLVSPFVRMWPELRRALARAVSRGVSINLITRGPNGGPRDEDLAVFGDLEADIKVVPELHLKAYLTEKEAIHTSVNLTRQSVDKSLESSLLFKRSEDQAGWNSVHEIWQKTIDDNRRMRQIEPTYFERLLGTPPRTLADSGDERARADHRYCIKCGYTASTEDDQVICLRCRAAAIAADGDPFAATGSRCARCNGAYGRSSVDRPFCDGCYRAELDRYARRPARWYVHGATGSIEAWSRLDGVRSPLMAVEGDAGAREAVSNRWPVLMAPGGWISAALTAATTKPVSLWTAAMPPDASHVADVVGVILERVPTKQTPACRDLPDFPRQQAMHVAFSRSDVPPPGSYWTAERLLAFWDIALPRPANPKASTSPEWVLRLMLAPRKGFVNQAPVDASRSHLRVDAVLSVPGDLRDRWKESATFMLQMLLGSLHSYEEAEVRTWLAGASPKVLDAIVGSLSAASPLGPAKLIRAPGGQIRDIPHRSDRVTAIRVKIEAGEGWHLKAAVSTAKKLPLN